MPGKVGPKAQRAVLFPTSGKHARKWRVKFVKVRTFHECEKLEKSLRGDFRLEKYVEDRTGTRAERKWVSYSAFREGPRPNLGFLLTGVKYSSTSK